MSILTSIKYLASQIYIYLSQYEGDTKIKAYPDSFPLKNTTV